MIWYLMEFRTAIAEVEMNESVYRYKQTSLDKQGGNHVDWRLFTSLKARYSVLKKASDGMSLKVLGRMVGAEVVALDQFERF